MKTLNIGICIAGKIALIASRNEPNCIQSDLEKRLRIYFLLDICEHSTCRGITFYCIFGYPTASPIRECPANDSITMNTTSSCPHDLRIGYPKFFAHIVLREALEIASIIKVVII